MSIDTTDVVEAQVPSRRYFDDREAYDDWRRADWRRTLNYWMYAAARRSHRSEVHAPAAFAYDPANDFDVFDPEAIGFEVNTADAFETDVWRNRYEIGSHGLPGELTLEDLVLHYGERTIAGTRPLALLAWSGTYWVLPRAYADMMDRWQERERTLAERARICTGCRAQGSRWGWRTVTPSGYVTFVPGLLRQGLRDVRGTVGRRRLPLAASHAPLR